MPIVLSEADEKRRSERQAGLAAEKAAAENLKANVTISIQTELDKDELNKTYFDYYNGIILAYEEERKNIDGQYITDPVTETDIQEAGELSGRLSPTGASALDAVRVDELDGGGLNPSPSTPNEEYYVALEASNRVFLKTGFSGAGLSVITSSAITASSTTFTINSAASGIVIGNRLVVSGFGGGGSCIMDVTNVTVVLTTTTVTFTFVTDSGVTYSPAGTINSGATISRTLNAFTNSERNSKTAVNAFMQNILNKAILGWQNDLTGHSGMVAAQKVAVDGNQDDNLDQTVSPALQTFVDDVTNYLVTTDVSDSGLASIDAILSTRATASAARKTAITSAKALYYDRRYNFVNLRVNKAKGSLVLYKSYSKGSSLIDTAIDFATLSAEAYET